MTSENVLNASKSKDQGGAHHDDHHHDHDGIQCCELHATTNAESSIVLTLIGGAVLLTLSIGGYFGIEEEVRKVPAAIVAVALWIPLFQGALREIRAGRPSSSTLVAIAIAAALATAEYFTAGLLAFILLLMNRVLQRTAWGAHQAIESLVQLTPDTARRINASGDEESVSVEQLEVGDRVRVLPGENLPADGRVIQGRSTIRQASLTGESAPVEVEENTQVYAATTNLTGSLMIEVTRVGADTTIGKVVSLISEAEQAKTPRQQIIEMVAGHYVWIIMMVALAVWILSDKTGSVTGAQSATEKAIAVLIVTCPGALLLASPTAMVAAFASAARLGVMVKSTETLESAARIDSVVLDKTGTVTTGEFSVGRLVPAQGVEAADLLAAAATAEQHSDHPLAKAILDTARRARVTLHHTKESEEVHGLGVRVASDAGTLFVGRASWLQSIEHEVPTTEINAVEEKLTGMSCVHVMMGDRYLGAIGLEDAVRDGAVQTVHDLRESGVRHVALLTGDRWDVAKRVADTTGVDHVEAECHPQEKHDYIENLTKHGRRVMMVGDGINDGPSLAAADVGVAMGMGGTDVAANSAGIALMTNDLSRLDFIVKLARKTRVIITQNIIASLIIAVIGVGLAASGNLLPIFAVFMHYVTDVFVIGNSFRLVRFGEELTTVDESEDDSALASERRAWATASQPKPA